MQCITFYPEEKERGLFKTNTQPCITILQMKFLLMSDLSIAFQSVSRIVDSVYKSYLGLAAAMCSPFCDVLHDRMFFLLKSK